MANNIDEKNNKDKTNVSESELDKVSGGKEYDGPEKDGKF